MDSKKEMYLYGAIAATLLDMYLAFSFYLQKDEMFAGIAFALTALPVTGFAAIFWLLWIVQTIQSKTAKDTAPTYSENPSQGQKHISPKTLRKSAIVLIIMWLIIYALPSDFRTMALEKSIWIRNIFTIIIFIGPLLAGILLIGSFIDNSTKN